MPFEIGFVVALFVLVLILFGISSAKHKENEEKIECADNRITYERQYVLKEMKDKAAEISRDVTGKEQAVNARVDDTLNRVNAINDESIPALETQINALTEMMEVLGAENRQLRADLEETKKKLNFYANIEEDSANLTVDEDAEERKRLLEKAKAEIFANKEKKEPIPPEQESAESVLEEKTTAAEGEFVSDYDQGTAEAETVGGESVLDAEQREACRYMEMTNENVFVTGKAGTGKSFLLDAFVNATEKSVIVLAPTGIAALNVGGATLHKTFGYDNLENLSVEALSADTLNLKSEKVALLRNVQAIVIDEISMVRADTFDKIDKILKVICGNNASFGGKQMLVFGDLFQLPPICKGDENRYLSSKYGGVYFFHSNAYKAGNFKFIELSINHRQNADQAFFEILNRVREGRVESSDIATLNKRVTNDRSAYDRFSVLLPTKAEAERENQMRLQALESREFVYQAEVVIGRRGPTNFDNKFPVSETLRLKVGALVMMVSNDPDQRWVNGSLGIVKELRSEAIFVSINKQTYEVHRQKFEEKEVSFDGRKIIYQTVFSITQFPVVLAYALTIHKSQGQTFQSIACNIHDSFADGQAYVALSRCASLEGLHLLSPVSMADIRVNQNVKDFYLSQISNK